MKKGIKKLLLFSLLMISSSGVSLLANDSIPGKQLKDYAGSYIFPENQFAERVSIELKNDTLVVVAEIGSINLTFLGGEKYEAGDFGVYVVFIKNELTQKVTGVKVLYPLGDFEITGKKENE
jgi:hypothetical protein